MRSLPRPERTRATAKSCSSRRARLMRYPSPRGRYDELAARAAMLAIPGFRWCPSPGCAAGQVDADGTDAGAVAPASTPSPPARPAPPAPTTTMTTTTTAFTSSTTTPNAPFDAATTCHLCGHASCGLCASAPHVGMTCGAAAKTSADAEAERQSNAWLRRNAKLCPGRGCERRIEKAGGCEVVQCTSCWVVFWWGTAKVFED